MDHIAYKWATIFPQILWNSKPQRQVLGWGSNGHITNMNYIFIKTSSARYLAEKLIPWLWQNQGIHNQNCEIQSLNCWGRGVTFWCYMVGINMNFLFGRFGRGWLLAVKPSINNILWLKLTKKPIKYSNCKIYNPMIGEGLYWSKRGSRVLS